MMEEVIDVTDVLSNCEAVVAGILEFISLKPQKVKCEICYI